MDKKDILIVDDDPRLRKTLSDILKAKGYTPITAAEGKEALDKVREKGPALALIDLKLEDMSGLEVLKGIKEYSPGTECIVITGHASQESAIKAVNLGAYSYVRKPYDMEQLLLTVQRAIEKQAAEESLRENTERLLKAQRIAKMGFLDWNLKTYEMVWSDQIYDLYSVDKRTENSSLELTMKLMHPDDREFVEKNLEMAIKGEK
ncbi:MAG: response regulator, partial [Proteobacteria bacterium]|nr:response regulator [Pseudomonadota bacterium]